MFCDVKPIFVCTINLSGVAQGFEGIASNQPRLRTKMRGYLTRGRVGSFRTIVASGCFVYTRNEFLIQIDVLHRWEATFRGNWAAPVVDLVVGAVVVAVVVANSSSWRWSSARVQVCDALQCGATRARDARAYLNVPRRQFARSGMHLCDCSAAVRGAHSFAQPRTPRLRSQ